LVHTSAPSAALGGPTISIHHATLLASHRWSSSWSSFQDKYRAYAKVMDELLVQTRRNTEVKGYRVALPRHSAWTETGEKLNVKH